MRNQSINRDQIEEAAYGLHQALPPAICARNNRKGRGSCSEGLYADGKSADAATEINNLMAHKPSCKT